MKKTKKYFAITSLSLLIGFFNSTFGQLTRPVLLYPVSNATAVERNPILQWTSVPEAISYKLRVSDLDGNIIVDENGLSNTSYLINLGYDTYVSWQVSATDNSGSTVYSYSSQFRTTAVEPTLQLPYDGSIDNPTNPSLVWSSDVGGVFEVQLSKDIQFNTIVINYIDQGSLHYTATGLEYGTKYYWRVRRLENSVPVTLWSTIRNFTTIPPPPSVPSLATPLNSETNISINPTLNWDASTNAAQYCFQVALDRNFTNNIKNQSQYNGTSVQIWSLSYNTTYYWRVKRTNSGGESDWSEVRSFTTILGPPSVPTLASPSNGVINYSLFPTLNWNSATDAYSYKLQLSTDAQFSNPIIDEIGLTNISYNINTKLTNNQQYYWRVASANLAGISDWSSVWNFTAKMPVPAIPTIRFPVNGASNVSTIPTLSWENSPYTEYYWVQIATDYEYTNIIVNDSWVNADSYIPSELANNTFYYWRVKARNSTGSSEWSGLKSFKTCNTSLLAPWLLLPGNGSTNINLNPALNWNAVNAATTFSLQVSTSNSFNPLVIDATNLTSKIYNVSSLILGTEYYWRVSANSQDGASSWSDIWKFTTVQSLIEPPNLSSPLSGNQNIATNPTLNWNASSGTTAYHLQVSTSSQFTELIVDRNGLTNVYENISNLALGTTYYWRVNASDQNSTSAWSQTWNFNTTTIPNAPVLTAPSNGTINVASTPTITWNASDNATSYQLQISTSDQFTVLAVDKTNITSTSDNTCNLKNNTTYFWRVRVNSSTGTSDWSSVFSFTTLVSLATPALISPDDGSSNVLVQPSFSWQPSAEATSYQLQISTDIQFVNLITNKTDLTSTMHNATPLNNGITYYWRVCAANVGGTSLWSSVRSFRIPEIPTKPELSLPVNGAIKVLVTPTLSWSPSDLATSYSLQVSRDSSFTSFLENINGLTSTSYSLPRQPNDLFYYWRVNASNEGGTSSWSDIWNFRIESVPLPAAPLYPCDEINIPLNPIFSWQVNDSTSTTGFQLSTDPDFDSLVVNLTGLSGSSYQVNGLNYKTVYYWRTNAVSNAGTSVWAHTWSFTTVSPPPQIPLLVFPINDSKDVDINYNLSWNSALDADSYELEVSGSSTFDSLSTALIKNISALSFSSVAGYNKQIFWRVRSCNLSGKSDWSATWNFSTIYDKPLMPIQVSPITGDNNVSINPTLSWSASKDADTYHIQVSTDGLFNSCLVDVSGITSLFYNIKSLCNGKIYYWRVNATNSTGISDWSTRVSFATIRAVPSIPICVSPLTGSTNIALTVLLIWNKIEGACSYGLQVSPDSLFSSFLIDNIELTDTSYNLTGLDTDTKYYWKVHARNPMDYSPWSTVCLFQTVPYAPMLKEPANGSNDVAIDSQVDLKWMKLVDATTYEVKVSSDNSFANVGNMLKDTTGIADTTLGISGSNIETTYYWKVRGTSNEDSSSSWSQVWSFRSAPLWRSNGIDIFYRAGNVGIGTRFTDKILTVKGQLHTNELIVESSKTPDYVFEKSYNLNPLEEVESFVKTNKHLPEIPSAVEIKKEGLKLGEMNIKLLKKIEELTLYLIDLRKVRDGLKRELDGLSKWISD